MADLISREALLSELEERFDGYKKRSQRNIGAGFVEVHKEWAAMAMGVAECLAIVRCAPTVDAVEVCRCKDCKYCVLTVDGEYNPQDIVCEWWQTDGLKATAFCSYGERISEVASEVMMQPMEG